MAINRRDIFISYSHDDVAFLDQLKEELRLHRISPWMDEKGIKPGDPVGPILSLAFSPNGNTLATVVLFKDITVQPLTFVQYWDVATGAPLASGFDYGDTIAGAAFSNDGKRFLIASAQGSAGTILRYDYGLAVWQYRACAVANRGFSPDEMLLYQLDKKYRNVCATVAAPK